MKKSIGVAVSNLYSSQLSYLIIDKLNKNFKTFHGVVFFENNLPSCIRKDFACYNISEAYNFYGNIVATNLSTAKKILILPGPKEKFLYLWDLEWTRNPEKTYHQYAAMYRRDDIKIICRNEDHAKYFELVFNKKPDFIADNFDLEGIIY